MSSVLDFIGMNSEGKLLGAMQVRHRHRKCVGQNFRKIDWTMGLGCTRQVIRYFSLWIIKFIVTLLFLCSPAAAQQSASGAKRILVLFDPPSTAEAGIRIASGLQKELRKSSATTEIYAEYLDLYRFSQDSYRNAAADWLATKYQNTQPDLLIAIGPEALKFVLKHRETFSPNVPVVVGGITDESAQLFDTVDNVYGVLSTFDVLGTVDLAIRLQPDATSLVVMTGSAPFDQRWQATAREILGDIYSGIAVEYVDNLTLDEFVRKAASLNHRQILLVLTIIEDADGKRYDNWDTSEKIASASGAPAYTVYDPNIGRGFTGGVINSFEAIGAAAARKSIQILSGDLTGPRLTRTAHMPVLDWRQMVRWDLDLALLPENADLRYFSPPVWQQYRLQIALILVAIFLMTSVIALLLFERRRRQKAELEVRHRIADLARMNRIAVASELSASIAHEINQPLAAIATNGSAGLRWLAAEPAQLGKVTKSLERIVSDSHRASDLIAHMRAMFNKGNKSKKPVDINQVVDEAIDLMSGELQRHGVSLQFRRGNGLPQLHGDSIGLHQVVINLVRNALDAMGATEAGKRKLGITTELDGAGNVVLSVMDSGPGIEDSAVDHLFRPFFTTKPNGIGVGLSICRSIVEAHGGYLTASSNEFGPGAVFRVLLPVSEDQKIE